MGKLIKQAFSGSGKGRKRAPGTRPGRDGTSGRRFQGSTQFTGLPAGVVPAAPEGQGPVIKPKSKNLGSAKTVLG